MFAWDLIQSEKNVANPFVAYDTLISESISHVTLDYIFNILEDPNYRDCSGEEAYAIYVKSHLSMIVERLMADDRERLVADDRPTR